MSEPRNLPHRGVTVNEEIEQHCRTSDDEGILENYAVFNAMSLQLVPDQNINIQNDMMFGHDDDMESESDLSIDTSGCDMIFGYDSHFDRQGENADQLGIDDPCTDNDHNDMIIYDCFSTTVETTGMVVRTRY